MATGAIVARILTQYSDKGSKAATKDINKLGKSFDNFSKRTAKAFGLVALASAALAVKIGKDAVQAAIADQKSQALLALSLKNTAGATDTAIAGVENYITGLQKQFSVVDDDLRPAMGRLAALTGDITTAQNLMAIALDLSASSGADLSTAVGAITKAAAGQFKGLKTLAPGLSLNTMKTKDFAGAMEYLQTALAGAAATRAGTLEYRLAGLKIQFGEVLETLGYALLPVVTQFATVLQNKILPQVEAWVALNKDKLAAGLSAAAEMALKLFTVSVAFGDWVSNNTTIFKVFAGIIAGMWAVGKIAAFVTAIKTITTAMALLRATAAGAAIATAFATGGVSLGTAAAAIAAVGLTGYLTYKATSGDGSTAPSAIGGTSKKDTSEIMTRAKLNKISQDKIKNKTTSSATDFLKIQETLNAVNAKGTKIAKDQLTLQQKKYNLKLKEMGITTTQQQDAITQLAIIKNLKKQEAITGSPTIALGASGSLGYKAPAATAVNVYPQSMVSTKEDLAKEIRDEINRLEKHGAALSYNQKRVAAIRQGLR